MADNVVADAGTGGATFATDDIGGVHFPRAKMCWGADGSVNDTSVAAPLPVQLVAGAATVDISAASLAALEVIDLSAATLAALETIELGATTLTALETITIGTALPAGTNNIGDVDVVSFTAGAIVEVQGDVAHDAAVGGNPVLNGFEARTVDGTPVAAGDAVRGSADTLGKQVVVLGATHALHLNGKGTFTNTTAADLIAAQGAGIRVVVTSILVINGHATIGTKVEIRRGTTVMTQGYAAAAGGGWSQNAGGKEVWITAANEAVTARCVTTGADVDVFVSGYSLNN